MSYLVCKKVSVVFKQQFGLQAHHCIQVPDRVNLIGEHYVLPCAIDFQTIVAISARNDQQAHIVAVDYDN